MHPRRIFLGGKEIEKKEKKNLETPRKFQTPPKISDPPKNFRHPPGPGQVPPPPVDRQTPVNLLPWPNFVAAGKNLIL